jgi:hypothetical protein
VVEEAAVLIVVDDHRGLTPDLRVAPDRAEHLVDGVLPERGRGAGVLGLEERDLDPRNGREPILSEVGKEVPRIGRRDPEAVQVRLVAELLEGTERAVRLSERRAAHGVALPGDAAGLQDLP